MEATEVLGARNLAIRVIARDGVREPRLDELWILGGEDVLLNYTAWWARPGHGHELGALNMLAKTAWNGHE